MSNSTENGLINLSKEVKDEIGKSIIERKKVLERLGEKFSFLDDYVYENELANLIEDVRTSTTRMLFAGCRLIRIKELEERGNFLNAVEKTGLNVRTAQRMMTAAFKFIDDSGNLKYQNLAQLGITKIYDLAIEDDEVLEELEEGKTIANLNLDAADKMTTHELRQKLRDMRKDKNATEELVKKKDEKINELEKKLIEVESEKTYDWSEKGKQILTDLNEILTQMSIYNGKLNKVLDDIKEFDNENFSKEASALFSHAKNTASNIYDDAGQTVERLNWLAPHVPAGFLPGFNFGSTVLPTRATEEDQLDNEIFTTKLGEVK